MLHVGNMETVIFYKTLIPMGAMYLHTRTFWTLAHTTSILVGAKYLHARTFWTPCHCGFIWLLYPWVWCIYMQEHSEHLLIWLLYPWVPCIYMQERSEHLLIQPLYLWVRCISYKNVLYTHSYNLYICGAMYLHARMFCTLTDTILYPLLVAIFTVITKV